MHPTDVRTICTVNPNCLYRLYRIAQTGRAKFAKLTETYLKSIIRDRYEEHAYREAMTRIDKELHDLETDDTKGTRKGYYFLMMLISSIADDHTFPLYYRNKETGTLISYLLGITNINPLSEDSGGCSIPYKGEEIKSLEVSVVPALLHIIPDAMKRVEGISCVSEKMYPNAVKLEIKLKDSTDVFKVSLVSCDILVDIWQKEHLELGENYEDTEWEKLRDTEVFAQAANLWLKDIMHQGSLSETAQKTKDALGSNSLKTFVDLIKLIQDACSSDGYQWPKQSAAEIARVYCILATLENRIQAA